MTGNATAKYGGSVSVDEQKLLDSALLESDEFLKWSLQDDESRHRNRLFFIVLALVILSAIIGWEYFLPAVLDDSLTVANSPTVAKHVEDFRRAAIRYDFSSDQVLNENLSMDDGDSRLHLFPGMSWPNGLGIGFLARDSKDLKFINADAHLHEPGSSQSYFFSTALDKTVQVGGYQFLIFDKGIKERGAVLVDSYAAIYCHGDMSGVINSQSYCSALISGNVTGKILNGSYGHWVVEGDFSGTFENESAATLRILGKFDGELHLWDREQRFSKVFIAGHTPKSTLERITGSGFVYLEKSDLPDGVHDFGKLKVFVGENQNATVGEQNHDTIDNDADFKKAWQSFFARDYVESEKLFRAIVQKSPDNPHVKNGLGWSLINQKRYAEAKPWIEQAIATQDELWGALSGLGVILKEEGNIDAAVEVWERIAESVKGPNDATANLADVAMDRKEYGKAVEYYKKLLLWFPDHNNVREKLAEAEAELEKQNEEVH